MRRGFARPLVESALLATLSAVLVLLAFYAPILGLPVSFVSPLPVALAVIRHGGRWGLLASIVGTLALLPFTGWITAVSLWVVYGWIGLVFGFAIRRRYPYATVLLLTSVAAAAGAIAGVAATYLVSGISPTLLFDQMVDAMNKAMEIIRRSVGDSPQLLELIRQITDRDTLLRLIPGSFVLASVLLSYVNVEVLRRFLPRFGYNLDPLPPFSRWILPEVFAWLGLASFVASVYLQVRPEQQALIVVAQNTYSVASTLGTLEVFSIVSFLLLRAGFPRLMVGFALFFVFSLIATVPLLSLIVPISGMMDMLLDFRRLRYGFIE